MLLAVWSPVQTSVRVPALNDLHCNKQSWYANETRSGWAGGQKNADKIRGYFILGLAMCTIPFNNPISPQNSYLSLQMVTD